MWLKTSDFSQHFLNFHITKHVFLSFMFLFKMVNDYIYFLILMEWQVVFQYTHTYMLMY